MANVVKIKGKDVLVNGEVVARIDGWRDPSGKAHRGFHIVVPGHGTIGHWITAHGEPKHGRYIHPNHGAFAYAKDAQDEARRLFADDSWKNALDHVVKASREAAKNKEGV